MKRAVICIALVSFSICLWAQTPAPAPAQPAPPMHHGMHHDMAGMQDHMQAMKAQVEKMRATLEKMKASVVAEKGSKEQVLEQQNIELWEAMISHLEGMISMMSAHGGMPPMGMMHDGMGGCSGDMKAGGGCCSGMKNAGGGCCGGNKCMQPAAPDKPAAPAM